MTKVPGGSLTAARENNLGSSIQGRVAGVNVTKSATGAGGSSRVIIRGNKSIGGDNQPLYVIDGIPMDNSQFGQVGVWGGTDQGDGLTSLNPEDIESITVLKGAAAAALYGSRGGYGVINVTTKKGAQKKGIGIELTQTMSSKKFTGSMTCSRYMDQVDRLQIRLTRMGTTVYTQNLQLSRKLLTGAPVQCGAET